MKAGVLALVSLAASAALAAPLPEYALTALRDFPKSVLPADLGYSVEITRNGRRTVERYDPTAITDERWTLLTRDGQRPDAAQQAEYRKNKAKAGGPGFHADFSPEQIDRESLVLQREDSAQAVFSGRFKPDAAEGDALLGRLELRLTIRKRSPALLAYELRLSRPFSPVLGVKMTELVAGAEYDQPERLAILLPRRTYSRFNGRIFLMATKEDLDVTYRDFVWKPASSQLGR